MLEEDNIVLDAMFFNEVTILIDWPTYLL